MKRDSKSIETGTVSISSPNNIGVYGRFRSELKKSYFFLEEANGEHIDVVQSFAPLSPSYPYSTLFIRIVFLSWSLGSLVDSILSTDAENRFIWIGYLTNWGFILSICFQVSVKTNKVFYLLFPKHYVFRLTILMFSLLNKLHRCDY